MTGSVEFLTKVENFKDRLLVIDILTIFPELFQGFLSVGLLSKGIQKGLFQVFLHNFRAFGVGKTQRVDDVPFGGGEGMVLKVEPIVHCLESILARATEPREEIRIVCLTPKGRLFDQAYAETLRGFKRLILICGRYEGIDERISAHFSDVDVSIGNYILSGGEVAAMAVVETVCRLIPGFVGNPDSICHETFSDIGLKYPQYTRPRQFREYQVPEVLISGNHEEIRNWRAAQSVKK